MKLSERELHDPIWLKLKAHYDTRLAELRKQNDSDVLDAMATAKLRGRIMEIKKFLDIGNPSQDTED